jgi:CRP-like cAMP-binding protein
MKSVGFNCKTLLASLDLQKTLIDSGRTERFRCNSVLFSAGDENTGVFLVGKGKVCMRVPEAPKMDRVFGAGSVLGLPSTFTGGPYSLTAVCVADCKLVHAEREKFLELMSARTDSCQEAIQLARARTGIHPIGVSKQRPLVRVLVPQPI